MLRIFVTTDFCNGCKQLVNSNSTDVVNNLRTVLIKLVNGWDIPKKFKDHQLNDSPYRELHLSGNDLLLYRYEVEKETLVLDLKLAEITDHKGLRTKSHKDQHTYFEVDPEFLHDVTSSTHDIDSVDSEFLNDFLESISDYASTYLADGYVLLDDYNIVNNVLHCTYTYYLYSGGELTESGNSTDSIDFAIDLDKYAQRDVVDLNSYLYSFSKEVASAFEDTGAVL